MQTATAVISSGRREFQCKDVGWRRMEWTEAICLLGFNEFAFHSAINNNARAGLQEVDGARCVGILCGF